MLHVIAIAEMFLVQNSTRNQSKPKQSHGHCVRCEVIKTGSPQNYQRHHHECNNYSTLEDGRRWRISSLFFQFSYHIFGQLSRINKQPVANHAVVLIKQTTLFALNMKHLLQLVAFQILMYHWDSHGKVCACVSSPYEEPNKQPYGLWAPVPSQSLPPSSHLFSPASPSSP